MLAACSRDPGQRSTLAPRQHRSIETPRSRRRPRHNTTGHAESPSTSSSTSSTSSTACSYRSPLPRRPPSRRRRSPRRRRRSREADYLSPTLLHPDPTLNVYSHIGPADVNPATAGAAVTGVCAHEVSGTVMVIDPATQQVIDNFATGPESQHVIPSWDMTRSTPYRVKANRITRSIPQPEHPATPSPSTIRTTCTSLRMERRRSW